MGNEQTRTDVIFRWWKNDVIAIFPEWPTDSNGIFCDSYQHFGQHGSCDPQGIIHNSRLATTAEYADLETELEIIGYNLNIKKRQTPKHRKTREGIATQ